VLKAADTKLNQRMTLNRAAVEAVTPTSEKPPATPPSQPSISTLAHHERH
jgi:hypothetical protein